MKLYCRVLCMVNKSVLLTSKSAKRAELALNVPSVVVVVQITLCAEVRGQSQLSFIP